MKSMTSYAYADTAIGGIDLSCELKSYNSRFLDLNIMLPAWMSRLEPFIRRYFSTRIGRGKVEFYVRVKKSGAECAVTPNIQLAEAYCNSMKAVAAQLGMESQVSLALILNQEGVLQFDRNFEVSDWEKALPPILDQLFHVFETGRMREGAALLSDIQNSVCVLKDALAVIRNNAARMEAVFTDMLKKKYAELSGHEQDMQRFMQEVAILLVKYTINEEQVRAEAHIQALEEELHSNSMPGRKIDFLCQEINREINTIGSKNQLVEIGYAVITAKNALENIREQARNIE